MRWSLDGAVQFQIEVGRVLHSPCTYTCHAHAMHTRAMLFQATMLHAERKVSWPDGSGRTGGTMRSRQMPTEPMYMMLNVDSSPRWGWPSHTDCEYEEKVTLTLSLTLN